MRLILRIYSLEYQIGKQIVRLLHHQSFEYWGKDLHEHRTTGYPREHSGKDSRTHLRKLSTQKCSRTSANTRRKNYILV